MKLDPAPSNSVPRILGGLMVMLWLAGIWFPAGLRAAPATPETPGWGMPAQFAAKTSYWAPLADGVQSSAEVGVDVGGTWMVPSGPPIPQLAGVVGITNLKAEDDSCAVGVTGQLRVFTLNDLEFRCFVPPAVLDGTAPEKIWVLNLPATNDGSMHGPQSNPQFFPKFTDFATCTYEHQQAGRPMNTVVNGYWALAKFVASQFAADVDKVVFAGGSFGSYSALLTAIVSAGDPQVPLAGVYGGVAFSAEPYLDLLSLVSVTNDLHIPYKAYRPWGQDQEVLRTYAGSAGVSTLAQIDPIHYIGQIRVPVALIVGESDFSSADAYDLAQIVETASLAAGTAQGKKVYAALGSHTADGPIQPLFLGDGNDWYAGLPAPDGFDLCRDYDLFIQNEVMGKPLPVTTPIPIQPPVTPWPNPIASELSPDLAAGASGPSPGLLTFDQRLGYGSQLAARDGLVALDSGQPDAVDLIFGNAEGEVMRLTVGDDGSLVQRWLTRTGYRAHSILRIGETIFVAAADGRCWLLDIATGAVLSSQGPGHAGRYPDRPVLGTAYDANDQPVELIFLANRFAPGGEVSEIVGLDPVTLARRFSDLTVGTLTDWEFYEDEAGEVTVWIALRRGHGIRVRLSLPDCVEMVAITDYIADDPQTLMMLEDTVLLSGLEGTYWFDAAGNPLATPGGGSDYFSTGLSPASPSIVKPIAGSPFLIWYDDTPIAPGGRVGLTDLTGIGAASQPAAPLAAGEVLVDVNSMVHHAGRLYGTSASGALLRFEVTAGGLLTKTLNLPTNAVSWGLDAEEDDLMLLDRLERDGLSLLRLDFGPGSGPGTDTASLVDAGYQVPYGFQWGQLHWRDGGYYVGIGSALEEVGGQTTLFTARTHVAAPSGAALPVPPVADATLGHLAGFQDFLEGVIPIPPPLEYIGAVLDGPLTGTKLRYPHYLPFFSVAAGWPGPPAAPPRLYAKQVTYMTGDFNLGHQVRTRRNAAGDIELFFGGSDGVHKYRLDPVTGDVLGTPLRTADLGWRAVGLELGTFRQRPVVFAGQWATHATVVGDSQLSSGHTFVLNASTLQTVAVLDTGLGSWGVKQADLDGDGRPETFVGSATHLQVFDDDLNLLYRSPPLTTFWGAYGLIVPLDGDQPCDWRKQQSLPCLPDRVAVGTTGGVVFFDLQMP